MSSSITIPATGGGGGANNNVVGSATNPNTASVVPPDVTKPSFYYRDNSTIAFWQWSINRTVWDPVVT